MSEPDPLAALAAQLKELRGQLARTQGELGAVREGLKDETSQTALAWLEIKQLRGELAEAVGKRRLKPPPAPWWPAAEAEARAMMAELREWVERFLRPNYPDYLTRLPGCWASHAGAAWELATLRAEWVRIYGDEENRDLPGALTWHDKYLPGVISRLAEAIRCPPGACQLARTRPA